jgi:hypothetical protein
MLSLFSKSCDQLLRGNDDDIRPRLRTKVSIPYLIVCCGLTRSWRLQPRCQCSSLRYYAPFRLFSAIVSSHPLPGVYLSESAWAPLMSDTEQGAQSSHTQCPPTARYEVHPVVCASHSDVPSSCLSSQMSPGDTTNRQGHRIDIKACLTVFGAFLAMFCTFGQMNSFGTYQAWYKTHQLHDRTPSEISWVGSLQLWVFFLSVCRALSVFFCLPMGDVLSRVVQ